MRQFELRWANLPRPAGRRPVLLLSRTPTHEYLQKVLVAEVANLDAVRLIERSLIGDRVGFLAASRHREVKRAMGYALDWAELKTLA